MSDPVAASTVILLRDGAGGLEVYLLRRVAAMTFAGGMTVFPGGKVDPSDHVGPADPIPAGWPAVLSADEAGTRALVRAAIRETYEETGVLLGGTPSETDRQALERHERSLADVLPGLPADLLRPWAHWITPVGEPRRYDTRFFLAALPAGQHTRDVTGEAEVAEWVAPAEALREHAAGARPMLPPTVVTLRELTGFESVAAAWAAAAERRIEPILPTLRGSAAVLPGGESIGLS